MKTIDKYIIKKKILYLISTTFVIFSFICVINFFENINMLAKKNLTIEQIIKNSLLTSPFYTYLLTPIISMISSVLLLNYFKTTSQYKAIYASGYNSKTFLKNILFVIVPFSIILLFLDNFVSDLYSTSKNKNKYSEVINFKLNSIIFQAKLSGNLFLEDSYIYDLQKNIHMYVSKIYWDNKNKKWYGESVKEIIFSQQNIKTNYYKIKEIENIPTPKDFILEEITDPNSYSVKNLIERVKKLKKIALNTNQELTLIFFRITIISMNITAIFIVFLIFRTNLIDNKGTGITVSVLSSLLMWLLLTILKRSSDIEIIKPYYIFILQNIIMYMIIFYFSKKIKSCS